MHDTICHEQRNRAAIREDDDMRAGRLLQLVLILQDGRRHTATELAEHHDRSSLGGATGGRQAEQLEEHGHLDEIALKGKAVNGQEILRCRRL